MLLLVVGIMFLTARCSCSGNFLKLYILSVYWKLYIRSQLIAGSDRKNYRDDTMDNPLASIYGCKTYDTASETERTPVYFNRLKIQSRVY